MSTNWKTIRVFINSTFRNMQAKRDQMILNYFFATISMFEVKLAIDYYSYHHGNGKNPRCLASPL